MADPHHSDCWRPVHGFSHYEVSVDGRVRALAKYVKGKSGSLIYREERILRPVRGNRGYLTVGLWRDRRCKIKTVHSLVAEAFLPRPEWATCIRHLDGSRDNNRVENLAWGTAKENADDRARHGRTLCGENNPTSRYSENQIREVVSLLADGRNQSEVARMTGVGRCTVNDIALGQGWRSITALGMWSALRPER